MAVELEVRLVVYDSEGRRDVAYSAGGFYVGGFDDSWKTKAASFVKSVIDEAATVIPSRKLIEPPTPESVSAAHAKALIEALGSAKIKSVRAFRKAAGLTLLMELDST